MKTLTSILLFAATAAAAQPIDYRFDQVKRKVTLNQATATAGQRAAGGDKVETGWFSYALIGTEQYKAKFEIFASTQVKLAEGTPGVLLSVERGRIRAMFDKITGSEPRVVKTPGAMLAVRGTQFDVNVDNDGRTTVDVFEGMVEVRSELLPEPLLLRPGQQSVYGRRERPTARPMPESHRRNDPNRPREPHGDRPDDPLGMPRDGGGHHRPPPAQPQPQPRTPPAGHH